MPVFSSIPNQICHAKDIVMWGIQPTTSNDNTRFQVQYRIYTQSGTPLMSFTTFMCYGNPDGSGDVYFDLADRLHASFLESNIHRPTSFLATLGIAYDYGNIRKYVMVVDQFGNVPTEEIDSTIQTTSISDLTEVIVFDTFFYAIYGGSPFIRQGNNATWLELYLTNSAPLPFLTLAPLSKTTYKEATEYLNYLQTPVVPVTTLDVKVDLYYSDGTSSSYIAGGFGEPDTFYITTIACDYTNLSIAGNITSGKTLWYYEVSVINDDDNSAVTEKRRFYLDETDRYSRTTFMYMNSLGGWETIHFTGPLKESAEIIQRTNEFYTEPYQIDTHIGQSAVTEIKMQESFHIGSVLPSAAWARNAKDFLASRFKYILKDQEYYPIMIVPGTFLIVDGATTGYKIEFDFKYKFTDSVAGL